MHNSSQKHNYDYLDELETIRKTKQRRIQRLSWVDYIMPDMASKMKQIDCVRAASEYGKYSRDFSADTCEHSNQTDSSDKERIDILTHQNKNLKEQLQYLREVLLKMLDKGK